MKKFFQLLSTLKKHLSGDFAYENYVEHAKKHGGEILSKKKFLHQRQREKWRKVNRCC